MTFQSQVVSDNSATSDMEDSEDPSTSDSESESDRLEDEVICLKSENMTLKERILELQKDLVISRNELHRCHDTLRQISSLRKPFCQPPQEILLMIFDRTIPPASFVDASASHTLNPLWGKVLRQKITMVNVCREWHRVGLPFLYEDICIQHISQLQLLLRTLENPATDISKFVKAVSFNCLIPKWFQIRFERRLALLFELCPKITSFSYLSSCPLPSPESLYVLPPHITHLHLIQGVPRTLLINVLNLICFTIISLSIHIPIGNVSQDLRGSVFDFRQLEELSLGMNSITIRRLNDFCLGWNLPLLTRLTFQVRGSWEDVPSTEPLNIFCQRHANIGLKFLHLYPEYGWSMSGFTLQMQGLLDICPNLEHIVVHPRSDPTLTHPRVKWVDLWTSHPLSACKDLWQSIRDNITTSTFPSLQGIRCLYSSMAFVPNLPLILPPDHVLTPLDSFACTFLELDVHHDVGAVYRRSVELEDEESDEDDESFVPDGSDSEYESEGSSSLDWDAYYMDGEDGDAVMDALE